MKKIFLASFGLFFLGNTQNSVAENLKLASSFEVEKSNTNGDKIRVYVEKYKEIAKHSMRKYGIPASIKLAQGILESGIGNGKLCVLANNHFGIKCKEEWTGETFSHTDDNPDECFRKYPSPLDSYNDHSEFIANRVYYKSLFSLPKNDYKAWANGLKKAGYATDPAYPQKLISLIERYELYKYDEEVLNDGEVAIEQVKNLSNKVSANEENIIYKVVQGDTLYAISNKFSISVEDLKKINNLYSNNISIGQIIKIK